MSGICNIGASIRPAARDFVKTVFAKATAAIFETHCRWFAVLDLFQANSQCEVTKECDYRSSSVIYESKNQDVIEKLSAALETSFVFRGIDKEILKQVPYYSHIHL